MNWDTVLTEELKKPKMKELYAFLKEERQTKKIYPDQGNVFNAFKLTPYDRVKVVILGDQPYNAPFTEHGLAFSSLQSADRSAILNNIFYEVYTDYFSKYREKTLEGVNCFKSNNLTEWAEQGVFMPNVILTCDETNIRAHAHMGWEDFMVQVVCRLNKHPKKLVFMLWGKTAKNHSQFIDQKKHLVLTAEHPSPFTADKGFFGCKHFTKANDWIEKYNPVGNKCSINWGLWQK